MLITIAKTIIIKIINFNNSNNNIDYNNNNYYHY